MEKVKNKGRIKTFIGMCLLAFIFACGFAFAGCGPANSSGTGSGAGSGNSNSSIVEDGALKTLVIKENYNNGIIAKNAFRGSDITAVKLPSNLTLIDESAFEGCTDLTEIIVNNKSQKVIFNNTICGLNNVEIAEDAFKDTKILSIDVKDSVDGDTSVDAVIKNIPANISKIVIKAFLNNETDIGFETEISVAGLREKSVALDFGTYGMFNNIIVKTLNADDELMFEESFGGVGVSASHYNFGYLNGSYPVLVYSLKLKEITSTGPTFTFLERSATYNWDSLPYGSQCLPFLTREQATSGGFHEYRDAVSDYIKTLYNLNNESTFSLYITDNYAEFILQFLVANQIPESNWNAYLLSDGHGTPALLNSTYSVDNPTEKHNKLIDEWIKVKNYTYVNGYDWESINSKLSAGSGKEYQMFQKYAYAVKSAQSNVSWWVNRLRVGENLVAINNKDATFASAIVSSVTQLYTNNLLNALSSEDAQLFKSLYKFSDDMFSVARDAEKKIMVILGTSWGAESDSFYNYVRLTIEFYGDDYVYYYKGHPGYPTALYPGRQEALEELRTEGFEIYELENAIAAEIILFFNPDIYLAGWQSSTYLSVENQTMACALFNLRKQVYDGDVGTYSKLMDMFISKIAANTEEFEGITLDATHQYYLVEYNNEAEYANQVENYNKHEIAIFDATTKTITYYHKGENSNYSVVDKNGDAVK